MFLKTKSDCNLNLIFFKKTFQDIYQDLRMQLMIHPFVSAMRRLNLRITMQELTIAV
jgi:hypothetical protein